jgi:group I intron endonuclease
MSMTKFYCYRIVHRESGKSYVGIVSGDVKRRWRQHRHEAAKGTSTLPLYRAMKAHGVEAFDFEVVHVADTWDEVCDKERQLIASLKTLVSEGNGYNLAEGGQGPFGVKRSPELRKRISERWSAWFAENPEAKERLRELGRQQMTNPERVALSREAALAQWANPELAAKSKAALDKFWSQPEAATFRSEKQKRLMSDPSRRAKLRAAAVEQMSNPASKEASRKGAQNQWANPEYRASRQGGTHPMARRVVADGIEYATLKDAANALGARPNTIRERIAGGVEGYAYADGKAARKNQRRNPTKGYVTREEWFQRFEKAHGDRYDYSQALDMRAREKTTIICGTHGPFLQAPDVHMRGVGCPKCGRDRSNLKRLGC